MTLSKTSFPKRGCLDWLQFRSLGQFLVSRNPQITFSFGLSIKGTDKTPDGSLEGNWNVNSKTCKLKRIRKRGPIRFKIMTKTSRLRGNRDSGKRKWVFNPSFSLENSKCWRAKNYQIQRTFEKSTVYIVWPRSPEQRPRNPNCSHEIVFRKKLYQFISILWENKQQGGNEGQHLFSRTSRSPCRRRIPPWPLPSSCLPP